MTTRRLKHLAPAWTPLALAALALAAAASADNWPGWRGPLGTGQSREQTAPLQWSATENVRWKADLPGPGMSSPIVWKDRVFLTQSLDPEGHRRALLCFDRADGRQLWQQVTEYADKESSYDGERHYCSATPATDGERVVASFGSAGLVCCDLKGKLLWRKDLGKCEQLWGNASSPVLYQDRVFLNFGPGERTFLIALDKKTGQELWKNDIPDGHYGKDQKEWTGSWSTPVLAKIGGREELVMSWPQTVRSYDPKSGKEFWRCDGLGALVYTSPIVTPDVVVAMGGFGGPAVAVKTGGSGDVTATHRLWREERNPQRIGSGVIVGDHIFLINATGVAQCIESKTGKTVWNERAGFASWGSMVRAGDRLYCTNQQGETVVLAAKPVFEVLGRNPLGERSQSTPAIADGEIFIRTYQHLWCIGQKS